MKKNTILFKEIKQENFTITPDKEDFVIEGYASVFGNIDAGGDVVMKGAFAKTLGENGSRVAMCYQHDMRNPVAKISMLKEDDHGLYFKARISDAEPDIKCKIKEGILKELSIGYQPIIEEPGIMDEQKCNFLKEVKLYELSLVTMAMNPLATIQERKSAFGIESLEDEFDRLIINESNSVKKFDLLKLKSIALAELAGKPPVQNEPQFDAVNYIKSNLLIFQ